MVGATTRAAAAMCGVNGKKAACFYHRPHEIIAHEMEAEAEAEAIFDGEIEVNERCFGGKRKGKRGC